MKHAKYLDIVQELRSLGWDPLLHVIILGTLGEIPRQLAELLTAVGVKDNTLETLQKDLLSNAIFWMDKCLDTELALSHALGLPHKLQKDKEKIIRGIEYNQVLG